MPELYEVVGAYTPLVRDAEEWRGPCIACDAELNVIGARWRCLSGCHDARDDAIGFLMLAEKIDEHGAQNLLDLTTFEPTLTKPIPPPPKFGFHRIAERPDAAVLITDNRKAAAVAEQLLRGYVVVCWPDGGDKWAMLEPLRGRVVLLWPSADTADMERLEAVLVDPRGLACTGKILTTGLDLSEWAGTGDDLIIWAKQNVRPLRIPAPAVAATPLLPLSTGAMAAVNEAQPATLTAPIAAPDAPPQGAGTRQDAPEARQGDAEPPPAFDPDDGAAQPQRPPRKRRLRVAGGTDVDIPDADEAPIPLSLSEAGVAAQFVALHKDKFRCVHEWPAKQGPTWVAWDGAHWKREPNRVSAWQDALTLGVGLKYTLDGKRLTEAGSMKFEGNKFMSGFLQLASYNAELIAVPEAFDADNLLLGCPTCTVDLRTGEAYEPRREDYITRSTMVDPIEGPTPLFDKVLACATNGESDAENYLWRLFGYILTGSCQEEQFTFLRGDEGSGKGTLVKALAEIMGEYACVSDMEAFTDSRSEKMPQHRAKLEGYRFTYASETNQNRKWNEAQINYMTGRDKVEGQRLYENKRDFVMTAKILIYGNYVPKLRTGIAMGIKRRLHLIEYDNKIAEPDTTLKERLIAEYPAILYRMIQGCLDWQRLGGLCKPDRITENVAAYLTDQDDVNTWADECLTIGEHEQMGAAAAYQSYKSWTHANNLYCPSGKEFGIRLKARGWESKRTAGGTVYLGYSIKLRDYDSSAAPSYHQRDD